MPSSCEFNPAIAWPVVFGAVATSSIAYGRPSHHQNIQKLTTAAAKPTVETEQILRQELNALLQPDGDAVAEADAMFERQITDLLNRR